MYTSRDPKEFVIFDALECSNCGRLSDSTDCWPISQARQRQTHKFKRINVNDEGWDSDLTDPCGGTLFLVDVSVPTSVETELASEGSMTATAMRWVK